MGLTVKVCDAILEVSKKDTFEVIIMNKKRLKAAMALHGDTGKDLAAALSISQQRLSAKINERNGAGFVQKEILAIKDRYSLSADELNNIFF